MKTVFLILFYVMRSRNEIILTKFGDGNAGNGISNEISGRNNTWMGSMNRINGSSNSLIGNHNSIQGSSNFINGNNNTVSSDINPLDLQKIDLIFAAKFNHSIGSINIHDAQVNSTQDNPSTEKNNSEIASPNLSFTDNSTTSLININQEFSKSQSQNQESTVKSIENPVADVSIIEKTMKFEQNANFQILALPVYLDDDSISQINSSRSNNRRILTQNIKVFSSSRTIKEKMLKGLNITNYLFPKNIIPSIK